MTSKQTTLFAAMTAAFDGKRFASTGWLRERFARLAREHGVAVDDRELNELFLLWIETAISDSQARQAAIAFKRHELVQRLLAEREQLIRDAAPKDEIRQIADRLAALAARPEPRHEALPGAIAGPAHWVPDRERN